MAAKTAFPEVAAMPDYPPRRPGAPLHDVPAVASPSSLLAPLAIGIIVIGALDFAREIFVPLALAILLSFALGPLVRLLRRWHLGRRPSVIASVVVAFLLIFGIGTLIGGQLAHLAEDLPLYQSNIKEKIRSLRGTAAESSIVERASGMLKDLSDEMTKTAPLVTVPPADRKASGSRAVAPRGAQQQPPIPVEIHQPDPTALQIIQTIVGPLLQPLATTGIVVIFVIFFLLQREDLRDRFIRLAGARDLQRTTQALDEAGHRLSRYLLVQTAINASFGVVIGVGLWIIGIPNPVLWGIFAMLLRFVPYIGPVIAALFPATLALAVDPGWSMLLWTGALFLVVEPLAGQLVEPLVYSRSTGLSAVAVVVAAAFWTWLWGPIGLLLSTPLTLCLVVLGRHVERLEFLDIVLGDQPALTPDENFYQRMLADDPDEAAHQAEAFLRENPLVAYYDEVAIKGLALAQLDVNRGALDHERRVRIKGAVEGLIDDLSDHVDASPPSATPSATPSTGGEAGAAAQPWAGPENEPAGDGREKAVLCIAGRGSLDEAAAAMLAQLLERQGIGARVVPSAEVSAANMFRLDVTGMRIACLSYLEPGGFTNARYLVRRLRRKLPRARIVVGFWTLSGEDAVHRDALRETGADLVAASLRDAVDAVVASARDEAGGSAASPSPSVAKVIPAAE
jgi:predicted PurR-regulated permease PerM